MDVFILHLEDQSDEAFFVRRHLQAEKPEYKVTRVSDGGAFREALATRLFDVILSDYRLPGRNTDEALGYALWHHPNIPVIALTGEPGGDRGLEALARGAADYVTTADLLRLIPSIERALREAAGRSRESGEIGRRLSPAGRLPEWTFDPETLQIIDANPAAAEELGYAREEILSMRVSRLWAEEDEPRFRWHLGALRLNRQANFNGKYRRRDGSLFEASVEWSDLERKGRRVCVANVNKVL